MRGRLRTVAALLAIAATACGGAAPPPSSAVSARAQQSAPGRGSVETVAVSGKKVTEADNDGDGILDEKDREEVAFSGSEAAGALAYPAQAPAAGAAPPAPPPPPAPKPGPAAAKPPVANAPGAEEPERDTSKIVYTARITMAVYQVDQGVSAVERVARDMGGYLSLRADREITIRVPRARFQPALAAIETLGDVLHRDVSAQDVTDEYVDLEVRIKNARAMQGRLKQLLEKANVKEALEIEKELARVTQELELLEGKMKLLRDKIAYSTITVSFQPRGATLQTSRVQLPFPWLGELGLPRLLDLRGEP